MAGFLVAPVTWSSNISPLSFSMAVCLLSHFSCVRPFATPWTVARPAPLSMGFSRQEYWSRLPFPPPGDLHDPAEIEPVSVTVTSNLHWQAGSLPLAPPGRPHFLSLYGEGIFPLINQSQPSHSRSGLADTLTMTLVTFYLRGFFFFILSMKHY